MEAKNVPSLKMSDIAFLEALKHYIEQSELQIEYDRGTSVNKEDIPDIYFEVLRRLEQIKK